MEAWFAALAGPPQQSLRDDPHAASARRTSRAGRGVRTTRPLQLNPLPPSATNSSCSYPCPMNL
jgi:hypothetical protein